MFQSRKIVKFDEEINGKLLKGINTLANAVKCTMGPRGKNVLIERPNQHPIITKDGVTVAKSINLTDQFENLGVQVIKDASSRTAEEAGDGTTTSMVLAQALYSEGLKLLSAGHDAADLRAGIEEGVTAILKELRISAQAVNSDEELYQVALISANGEHETADLISRAVKQVGRDGTVTVEEAKGFKSSLQVVDGVKIDRGYLSPYFISDSDKMHCELENCLILICNKRFDTLKDLVRPLELAIESGHPILIVANELEGDAMQGLVLNRVKGSLKVCAIKSPGFGQARHEMLEDLAVLTGGRVLGEGDDFSSFTYEDFGKCKRVRVKRTNTLFVTGQNNSDDLNERIEKIREQLGSEDIDDEDTAVLNYRLNQLAGGIAVLRVGAASEAEMIERKDRVDDALHATKAALEEGVLPGGGVALVRASNIISPLMKMNSDKPADFLTGLSIVQSACQAPMRQIVKNTGRSPDVVVQRILETYNENNNYGYDARNEVYGDMIDLGILDPLKVVRCALENASSVASMLLSVGCGMIEDFSDKNESV
jgi:chaperonin GroEL